MLKAPYLILLCALIITSCSEDDGSVESSSSGENKTVPVEDFTSPDPPEEREAGPDPLLTDSWHLKNTGQKSFADQGGKVGEDVGLNQLDLNENLGEGIRLAFSDNGVEINHPELWPNHLTGLSRNYLSSSPSDWHHKNPDPLGERSIHAHGTAVTGLAVADSNNSLGSRGLAPKAKFAGFVYVGVTNSSDKMLDQAHGDFDIFNYSYGRVSCRFSSVPSSYLDQLNFGVRELRDGLGALYIKAAGNEFVGSRSECVEGNEGLYTGNANLEREHSSPYMIIVGANNARGRSASYSTPGSSLWTSAPAGEFGENHPALLTADLMGRERGRSQFSDEALNSFEGGDHPENQNCDFTSTMNGTSAATPLVSAAVALILEANPNLNWREVKLILAQSARKIDPIIGPTPHPLGQNLSDHIYQRGWQTNAAGFNFHNWYGFGAINVSKALELAKQYSGTLPKLQQTLNSDGEWKYDSGNIELAIPDADASGVEHEILVEDDFKIEAVQIRLSVDHTFASDIGVELISPSKRMVSQLMTINSGIAEKKLQDVLLLSNAFFGESSKGSWTLRVVDGAEEDLGFLKNWKINIWGHTDSTEGTSGSGLNLFSRDTEASSTQEHDQVRVKTLDYDQSQNNLKKVQRSPVLPENSIKESMQKSRGAHNAPLRKIVRTSGSISYEWETYQIPEVDSSLREERLLDFHYSSINSSRIEVYQNARSENAHTQMNIREVLASSGKILWSSEVSLPSDHVYAGSKWLADKEMLIVASRASNGKTLFWEVEKEGRSESTYELETQLFRERTKSKILMTRQGPQLFVWDNHFLHQWSLSSKGKEQNQKTMSFNAQKIEAIFESDFQTFVWTSSDKEMNLWKLSEKGMLRPLNKRSLSSLERRYLPLTPESFLVRHKDGKVWLGVRQNEENKEVELLDFPLLFDASDVQVKSHPEGKLVVLWAYEKKNKVFHQFKFYLEGSGKYEE